MPCAFHLAHFLRPPWGCQFNVPDERLIAFAGQTWCPFHLPLEIEGETSEKAAWRDDEQRIQALNEEIFAFIRDAKQRSAIADLSGNIFPGNISFESFSGDDDALPMILFMQASFGGRASFVGTSFGGEAVFAGARFGSFAWFEGPASTATPCSRRPSAQSPFPFSRRANGDRRQSPRSALIANWASSIIKSSTAMFASIARRTIEPLPVGARGWA